MKKIFTLLLVFCMTALAANAQIILDETFDYPDGNLTSVPTWLTAGILTTGTGRTIVNAPLVYSNSGGNYSLSSLGKAVNTLVTSSTDYLAYRTLTATPYTTGTYYLSFLFQAGVAQSQSQSEIMSFTEGSSSGAKVLVGKGSVSASNYRFATVRGSSSSTDYKWGATEFSDVNQVILIVVKWDFATQTSSLFLNPTIGSATEPTPEITDNVSTTIRATLSGIRFRCNGSSSHKFNVSGVRVSTTWTAAVAVPATLLDMPVIGSASSVTSSGFTANWTAVANASGYDVLVYQGTNLVNTTTASGQGTQSIAVTGLSSNTTYTYYVAAKGDGVVYRTSFPSSASAGFTTSGLSAPVVGTASNITASGFTANWSTVTNSIGYEIAVYFQTALISTTTADVQTTSSVAITGLNMGTSYTYKVTAKGDGVTFLNSTPSAASTVFVTLPLAVDNINTNFGDGTWGTVTPPPSSLLPAALYTFSVNGYNITDGVLYGSTPTGLRGEIHTNVMRLNKNVNSKLELPTVNALKQIEIHISGTDLKDFILKEYNSVSGAFDITIGTFALAGSDENVFRIALARTVPSKFRIENNQGNSLNIHQVITRNTNPTLLSTPTVGAVSDIVGNGFTAHWTPNDVNATGYKILVYASSLPSTTTLRNTFTVTGQATNSYVVAGIDTAAICTYKVVALGDGDVLFSDSYASAASASFAVAGVPTAIINPKFDNSGFKLYPNPASGNVNFDYTVANDSKVKMVIYSLNNQVVKSYINNEPHGAGTYSKSFDVSELKPGIYFVRFTIGTTSKTLKLVVKR